MNPAPSSAIEIFHLPFGSVNCKFASNERPKSLFNCRIHICQAGAELFTIQYSLLSQTFRHYDERVLCLPSKSKWKPPPLAPMQFGN